MVLLARRFTAAPAFNRHWRLGAACEKTKQIFG
jgi:hypothetical protein